MGSVVCVYLSKKCGVIKDLLSTDDLTCMLCLTALGLYFIAIILSFDLKTHFY